MNQPAQARPVQQVNNPVKPDKWVTKSHQFMTETMERLDEFLKNNPQYTKRDVLDVALRDYLHMPEPDEV